MYEGIADAVNSALVAVLILISVGALIGTSTTTSYIESAAGVSADTQKKMLEKVCVLMTDLDAGIESLELAISKAADISGAGEQAEWFRGIVIPAMDAVRKAADGLEVIVDADIWPLPTYPEVLFIK